MNFDPEIPEPDGPTTDLTSATLQGLVRRSQRIIRGRVLEVRTHDSPHGDVWTSVVLTDNTTAKGAVDAQRFRFLCRGGMTEKKSLKIEGIPSFTEGDEVIIFYAPQHGYCQVTGWNQGVLRIAREPATRRQIVFDDNGRIIAGISPTGFVKGRKPDWLTRDVSAPMALVGEPTSLETEAVETMVTADDVFEQLRIIASTTPDESVEQTEIAGTEADFIPRVSVPVNPLELRP